MRRTALALTLLLGSAAAHTRVTGVTPGAFQALTAPKEVVLTFNEPVNLNLSRVKVYPLTVPAAQATDKRALNRAAAELARTVLTVRGDEEKRADTAPKLSGEATLVVLPLKAGLPKGAYAILWQVMSADGHPVTGQSIFHIK